MKTRKLVVIQNCNQCPHFLPFGECHHPNFGIRMLSNREAANMNTKIPAWCPLPDAEETK